MLTAAERKRLDRIFRMLQLFRHRGWSAALEADWDHGVAFLRRGPLLLFGTWTYGGFFVITPFHADLGELRVKDNSLQEVEVEVAHEHGEAVRIYEEDEGSWWDFLRQELPHLESWLRQILREQNQRLGRDQALQRAEAAIQTVLRYGDRL